ncbi:uncharacterized protein HMPREF1541_10501 [Cyphellophora europaea CBS 101466]|uniref:Signal peptidase complex subunit 2 n=1 Tax=Cyphellophora europaea (strain CBS 101466) TaxID=1220924 RepID=W2S6J6_CYPE1|nr:uncharacterized protein HMPREF1541_10501 [Cyphellophora europaea CBS 101466]ETN44321.1 hypothetical protein HMPREF1541_10501 [Cyphellophora europaea CBS 101466]
MTTPKPQKVPLYSLPDLKSAIDEALPPILTSLPASYRFTQSHYLSTVRLTLGYSAVAIAGALFALDYKHGWDVTKPYTLPACVAYFILNGALTLWSYAVERGAVFDGRRPGGQRLVLRSRVQKPVAEYILTILYESPKGDTKWQDTVVSVPFAKLFNVHGYLQRAELKKWLAREIEVVGLADPEAAKAVMECEKELAGQMGVDVGVSMSGALGDTIEVQSANDTEEEGLSSARITRARSKSPLPDTGSATATPSKRGPGRPRKSKG